VGYGQSCDSQRRIINDVSGIAKAGAEFDACRVQALLFCQRK